MPHKIFISYSSWDMPVAEDACRILEANGLPCWIAPRDIPADSDFSGSVVEAIDECSILVLLLSSRANSSHQVVSEVGRATACHKPVVPLQIEDFRPSGGLEYAIASLHWLDAVNVPLEEALEKLVQIIQTLDLQKADGPSRHTRTGEVEAAPRRPQRVDEERETRRAHYDVFISYRRGSDAQTARLLRAELQQRDLRVFLDVDDLRSGHFDEALLERIREAPNFLVILSQHSLDRCDSPDDWLRREMACAIAENKNVVPIMMPDFDFPSNEKLPDELQSIRLHSGIPYSHHFFDAMIKKIMTYLIRPKSK